MSTAKVVVLDASVCAKWFREEDGSAEAHRLLCAHADGSVSLHTPGLCVAETLNVVNRHHGPAEVIPAFEAIVLAGIGRHELSSELAAEAARQCALLGCTFYDAMAPALAVLLGGKLVTADRRAHGAVPGVRFIAEQMG